MISRLFYAPGDWLGKKLTARQRRGIGAWLLILTVATMPLRYEWKNAIWLVWALSEGAIVISLATIVAAETPVETEREDGEFQING